MRNIFVGERMTDVEVGGGLINETDFDGDGRISYEEFVKMSMCVVLS